MKDQPVKPRSTPPPGRSSAGRRQVLQTMALGLGSVALSPWPLVARAADLPPLSPDDPQAKALKYVDDASQAGAPRKPDQLCNNCLHYEGQGGAERGPCKLFPGKSVAAKGWCVSWAQQGG